MLYSLFIVPQDLNSADSESDELNPTGPAYSTSPEDLRREIDDYSRLRALTGMLAVSKSGEGELLQECRAEVRVYARVAKQCAGTVKYFYFGKGYMNGRTDKKANVLHFEKRLTLRIGQ